MKVITRCLGLGGLSVMGMSVAFIIACHANHQEPQMSILKNKCNLLPRHSAQIGMKKK